MSIIFNGIIIAALTITGVLALTFLVKTIHLLGNRA